MKQFLNKHKVNITRWLYLNGILWNVSTSPELQDIQEKHYNNYNELSRDTFNDNVAQGYWHFVISCAEKLMREIQQHHGVTFIHVMHGMVKLNYWKIPLGVSVSFMVDFD